MVLELTIGKRKIEMNRQMNNFILVGVMILILTACGQIESASTPEGSVVEAATKQPEPTAIPADSSSPEEFRKYIGSMYPPLPEGLMEDMGMLIQDMEDYSLTLVRDGTNKMLWLNKLTHYDSNGTAYWEVKDVLALSNLEAGLTLIPDGCSLNGAPDSAIFVAGKDGTIRLAWQINTTLDTFESIPTNGIECQSDKAMDL